MAWRPLDFTDAELVFDGPLFTFEDDRRDYGEQRWVSIGLLRDKVVVIVHTEAGNEIRLWEAGGRDAAESGR